MKRIMGICRLSEMLRIYIAAMNIEQKTVAIEIGISESSLSRFLNGEQLPDSPGFIRILMWCTFAPICWEEGDKP